MARPKGTYVHRSPELEEAIIEGISQGVTLADLCRNHGIGRTTVYDWMNEEKTFAERFARARVDGFDVIAEECLKIADEASQDYTGGEDGDKPGPARVNSEHIQRSKLRIETRLKLLAKWDPKRFGDKVALTDGNGGPLQMLIGQLGKSMLDVPDDNSA